MHAPSQCFHVKAQALKSSFKCKAGTGCPPTLFVYTYNLHLFLRSEFNTESIEDIRPSSGSINRSSRASGKERSSSSTFQNELDSLPASPTVFGVKLRSTRQSRKSDDLLTERNVSSSGSVSPTSSGAPRPHTERTVSPSSPFTPISPGPSVENIKSKFSFKGFKRTKSNSSASDDVDSFKKDVSIDKNRNQVSTKATWYTGQDENSNQFDNTETNSNNTEISGSAISRDSEMPDKVNAKVQNKEEEIVTFGEPSTCFDKTENSESINEQNVFTDDVTLTCFTKTLENEKIIENPILQNTESVDFKHAESEDININSKTEEDISEVVLRKSRKENHRIDNDSLGNSNSGVFQVQMRKSGRVISIRDDNINGDYSSNGEDAHLDTKEYVTHLKEASNGEIASFNKEQSNSSMITNSRTVDSTNDIKFQTEEIPRSIEENVVDKDSINDRTNQQDTITPSFQNGDVDDTVFKDEFSSNLPADKQQLNLVAYHKLINFLQDLDTSYDIEYHTSSNDNPVVSLEELLSNNS